MAVRTLLFVVLLVGAVVPGWTGTARLPLLGSEAQVTATRVPLDPRDHARRRLGRLFFMGGVQLTSDDPAFGGFSSLTVAHGRFTLLSDSGNLVTFGLNGRGAVIAARSGNLPAGPGAGWDKRDRDSESMTRDPRTGQVWVGFERANAIWRYSPGFDRSEGAARPRAMRRWRENGGAESLVRMRDGRFVVLAEIGARRAAQPLLVFAGDPLTHRVPAISCWYSAPRGYDPADATELPDGRLLILNRSWSPPLRFGSRLEVVDPAALTPGAVIHGTPIADLVAPLTHDNFEGVAVTRENGRTIVWLVSDDNRTPFERTLLLKFRLD